MSIPSTLNPALLVLKTPLFPELDPRTTKPGTKGCILQLWKLEVKDYNEDSIKNVGVKGMYGFVRIHLLF